MASTGVATRAFAGTVAASSAKAGRRSQVVASATSTSRSANLRSAFVSSKPGHSLASSPAHVSGRDAADLACKGSLFDLIGGDLLWPDLGDWNRFVENEGAVGVYAPPEGGYEGRYAGQCKVNGYRILNINARGLGDLEAYLMKTHGVRMAHLGKQAIRRFDEPGLLSRQLEALPEEGDGSKGIVLWVQEAFVLTNVELQYLCLLPSMDSRIKVVAEVGSERYFKWVPLVDVAGVSPVMA